MIRIRNLSLLLVLICGLASCSKWVEGEYKDPDIELVHVEVVRAKLLEQQFILHFRIDNPNPMILPVRGLDYNLQLNGIKFAEGESRERFTIPAYGRKTFQVPIRTNLWRHLKKLVGMLEKPNKPVAYRLQAEVETGLLVAHKVHLSREGEIIPGDFIPE
jgi:LEA14-like dessication related protein